MLYFIKTLDVTVCGTKTLKASLLDISRSVSKIAVVSFNGFIPKVIEVIRFFSHLLFLMDSRKKLV